MWGIFEGFDKLRKKIASGMENKVYETISDILFWTTLKYDLPYYSFIFRNPDQLGTELNNAKCFRLGVAR